MISTRHTPQARDVIPDAGGARARIGRNGRRARSGPQRHRALDDAPHRHRRRRLQTGGRELREEDIARPSPPKHRNLNPPSRHSFTAPTPTGALRPPRDPDAPEPDEGESGRE
ncbi:hypothetical protein QFZ24_000003 [Streptomyces phaeochromogenes]|nr:hypothetical protein [Streptomyces phaeochromogenes]MDQ0946080.1 hypothetical protein [Streptomyces phaeochromogenes]